MTEREKDEFDSQEFKDAKPNGGGTYSPPGTYPRVLIEALKRITTKEGKAVVCEYEILESNVPEMKPQKGVGYVMKAKHQSYHSNVRRIVSELSGDAFEDVDGDAVRGAIGKEQPFAGAICSLVCTHANTRAGGKYTVHKFRLIEKSPMQKKLEEMAAAQAAAASK